MGEIQIICSIAYTILIVVLLIFLEKRLNFLHRSNVGKVPAEDSKALGILHFRLKLIIRFLMLVLLVGGIFIIIILL